MVVIHLNTLSETANDLTKQVYAIFNQYQNNIMLSKIMT